MAPSNNKASDVGQGLGSMAAHGMPPGPKDKRPLNFDGLSLDGSKGDRGTRGGIIVSALLRRPWCTSRDRATWASERTHPWLIKGPSFEFKRRPFEFPVGGPFDEAHGEIGGFVCTHKSIWEGLTGPKSPSIDRSRLTGSPSKECMVRDPQPAGGQRPGIQAGESNFAESERPTLGKDFSFVSRSPKHKRSINLYAVRIRSFPCSLRSLLDSWASALLCFALQKLSIHRPVLFFSIYVHFSPDSRQQSDVTYQVRPIHPRPLCLNPPCAPWLLVSTPLLLPMPPMLPMPRAHSRSRWPPPCHSPLPLPAFPGAAAAAARAAAARWP